MILTVERNVVSKILRKRIKVILLYIVDELKEDTPLMKILSEKFNDFKVFSLFQLILYFDKSAQDVN